MDLLAASLEVKGFTIAQYVDIFKGFTNAVNNIINDYSHNIHESNINRILTQLSVEQMVPKYGLHSKETEPEKLRHRASEIFSGIRSRCPSACSNWTVF